MNIYEFIQQRSSWEDFLILEEAKPFPDIKTMRRVMKIIQKKQYLKFNKEYLLSFALPQKVLLSEFNTSKKRTVYVYPEPYRTILKLAAMYMLNNYNDDFCGNSLAYTKGRSVKSGFRILRRWGLTRGDLVYKNDFSDYFNSINLDLLELELTSFIEDEDKDLTIFIMKLLREQRVRYKKAIITVENKGVMAGSPIAGILANIFMHKIDEQMMKHDYKYIRYADDTLITGRDALAFFKQQVALAGITLNPKKMKVMTLEDGITFLGFKFVNTTVDISDKALAKMKSRFKRRAKWYSKWARTNNVKRDVAVRDYIKKINYKLFSDQDDSINWSRWYIPNINTPDSLHYLDMYFQTCIRYLYSGTWHRGKKHYALTYKKMRELGYRSLVNEYYKY